jgi:hypothetical protein
MPLSTMIAIIALAAAAVPISIVWIVQRSKRVRLDMQAHMLAAPLEPRLADLEARFAVLEALVTDGPARLAREIEGLRATS